MAKRKPKHGRTPRNEHPDGVTECVKCGSPMARPGQCWPCRAKVMGQKERAKAKRKAKAQAKGQG